MGALIALPSRLRTGAASGVMKKSPLRPRPYYERVKQQLALLLRVLSAVHWKKTRGFRLSLLPISGEVESFNGEEK